MQPSRFTKFNSLSQWKSQVLPSMAFPLPQHVSTTPLACHRPFSQAHPTFIYSACPLPTDGAHETTSLSVSQGGHQLGWSPRDRILMVDTQHESSLCNQFRLESKSICHSTTPKVVASIVIAHPDPPPCFPPISDKLRPNFARTLISSEVAPHYLPSSLNCSPPPLLGHRFLGSSHHSPDRCWWLGGLFTTRTPSLFQCEVEGGSWWRCTMDGSRLLSCSMSTIGDRGQGSNESPWSRQGEGAGCIWLATGFLSFSLCKPEPPCFNEHEACLPLRSSSS